MSDTPEETPNEKTAEEKPSKELTTAQVAKLVDCKVAEIFSFKDYGSYVVAVTVDGQKLQANKNVKA